MYNKAMATPEQLSTIVNEQKEAKKLPKRLKALDKARETKKELQMVGNVPRCKVCHHKERYRIENLYIQKKDSMKVAQMVRVINKHLGGDLNITNFRNHFGLNKKRGSDEFKPAHFDVSHYSDRIEGAIQNKADEMIKESAKDVAIADLSLKRRGMAMAWMEANEGKEMFLDDKVGAAMLKDSINEDIDRKKLVIQKNAGAQLNAVLLGQIGLMGAIFGNKKPKDFIDVEPVQEKIND